MKSTRLGIGAIAFALVGCLCGAVFAGPTAGGDLDALKRQVAELNTRIADREATRAQATDKALETRVRALEARMQERAADEAPFTAGWKDGFMIQSADGQHSLKINAVLQTDGYWHAGDRGFRDTTTDTFVIKRARLIFSGQMYKYFEFFLHVNWDQTEAGLKDAFMDITYFDPFNLRIGRFTAPCGHEALADGWALGLMERSLMANLLPDREVGLMFHGAPLELFEYQVAFVNGADFNAADTDDEKEIITRVLLTPFKGSRSRWLNEFGVGGWFSWSNQQGVPTSAGASSAFSTTSGVTFFEWAPDTVLDGQRLRYGAELVWCGGPLRLDAEWARLEQDVAAPGVLPRKLFQAEAWYVQLGCVLTGEDATSTGVTPKNNFDPRNGKWGAFELVVRYSALNIEDDSVKEGYASGADTAEAYAVGLNWYLNPSVRMIVMYEHTALTRNFDPGVASKDGDAVMFRFQLTY